jgi:uncharacterized membrane protein YfcA
LGGYFVIGTAMSLIVIAAVGRFGIAELRWGVALVPGTLLGFAVSSRLTPWLDRGYTRPAVLAVAAVAGVAGVVRQLW